MFLVKPTKIYADDAEIDVEDEFVNNKIDNMGRVNKLTEGVFTEIVGSSTEISKIDRFLSIPEEECSDELNQYVNEYKEITDRIDDDLNRLALLEKLILQLRARNHVSDIKLSILREYIYARAAFYRDDKTTKDIRVIVDKTEFSGSDVEMLVGNESFMARARNKLINAMTDEIGLTIYQYERFKSTL